MNTIALYDSTLRDGAQGEGVSFSEAGKVRFAHLLDDFGVGYIEGGFAGSNPRDRRFFEAVRKEKLHSSKIVAFGSTRRVDLDAEGDPQLEGLLAADTECVAVYGKSWLLHVTEVLRTSPQSNLQIVADTVGFLTGKGRKVFFDAEHFFDGFKDNPEYALSVLKAAADAGAVGLVLCDTNGGTLPNEVFDITAKVRAAFPAARIGIHTHNDNGMAVANTIESVRAGARLVQGCINGYGERTGNADLVAIIPTLELKMGLTSVGPERLKKLCEVSLITDDLANQRPNPRQPYVGRSAFSHKAGMHVNAVLKNPRTFEHIDPEAVGNQRHVLVSELAGISNVIIKAKEMGEDLSGRDKTELRGILDEIKRQEDKGYSYESADGSFKILLQKVLNKHATPFEFDGFRVIVEKRGRDEPCISEATIKVKVNGETELTAGEGHGPVDALNEALRKALTRFYPEISAMTLTDYRVRILDPKEATRAMTRVLIESGDKTGQWGTVGVSENIIEASWQALLDSVEYKLLESR
jgi:2-isopropylmalate synthase